MLSHHQRPVRAAQAFICSRTECEQEAAAFWQACLCMCGGVCVCILLVEHTGNGHQERVIC